MYISIKYDEESHKDIVEIDAEALLELLRNNKAEDYQASIKVI